MTYLLGIRWRISLALGALNRNLVIIHLLWLVIAIAAYVIGSSSHPGSPDDPVAPAIGGGRVELDDRLDALGDSPSGTGEDPRRALKVQSEGFEVGHLVGQALQNPNPLERSLAFAKLLERVDRGNGAEIFQALKDGKASREQLRLFLFAWGGKAGREALESVAEELEGDARRFYQDQILAGWASTEPQAAIAWAQAESQKQYQTG